MYIYKYKKPSGDFILCGTKLYYNLSVTWLKIINDNKNNKKKNRKKKLLYHKFFTN